MATTNFKDITLGELDESMTTQPDPNKDKYDFHYPLSDAPTKRWINILNDIRSHPRSLTQRKARVQGEYLIINCPKNELEKYHRPELLQDVLDTNKKYRQELI